MSGGKRIFLYWFKREGRRVIGENEQKFFFGEFCCKGKERNGVVVGGGNGIGKGVLGCQKQLCFYDVGKDFIQRKI